MRNTIAALLGFFILKCAFAQGVESVDPAETAKARVRLDAAYQKYFSVDVALDAELETAPPDRLLQRIDAKAKARTEVDDLLKKYKVAQSKRYQGLAKSINDTAANGFDAKKAQADVEKQIESLVDQDLSLEKQLKGVTGNSGGDAALRRALTDQRQSNSNLQTALLRHKKILGEVGEGGQQIADKAAKVVEAYTSIAAEYQRQAEDERLAKQYQRLYGSYANKTKSRAAALAAKAAPVAADAPGSRPATTVADIPSTQTDSPVAGTWVFKDPSLASGKFIPISVKMQVFEKSGSISGSYSATFQDPSGEKLSHELSLTGNVSKDQKLILKWTRADGKGTGEFEIDPPKIRRGPGDSLQVRRKPNSGDLPIGTEILIRAE